MAPAKLTGTAILVAGAAMIIVGVVLIAAVEPLVGGVIVIVGISDLVVGTLFRRGRLGIAPGAGGAASEPRDTAYGTTADGTAIHDDANPYARED